MFTCVGRRGGVRLARLGNREVRADRLRQAKLALDPDARLKVVRHMYKIRLR